MYKGHKMAVAYHEVNQSPIQKFFHSKHMQMFHNKRLVKKWWDSSGARKFWGWTDIMQKHLTGFILKFDQTYI